MTITNNQPVLNQAYKWNKSTNPSKHQTWINLGKTKVTSSLCKHGRVKLVVSQSHNQKCDFKTKTIYVSLEHVVLYFACCWVGGLVRGVQLSSVPHCAQSMMTWSCQPGELHQWPNTCGGNESTWHSESGCSVVISVLYTIYDNLILPYWYSLQIKLVSFKLP